MSSDTAVTDGAVRPEPPYQAPEGQHWEAVQADPEWSLAGEDRKCRYRGAVEHACGQPAALVRTRGIHKPVRWFYCAPDAARHYNVWPEAGKVMTWKLTDDPEE